MADHGHIAPGHPQHPADHHVSEHAPAHASSHAPSSPFTTAEVDELRTHDIAAARAVVILMLGIFTVGVVLYAIVAYTVMS